MTAGDCYGQFNFGFGCPTGSGRFDIYWSFGSIPSPPTPETPWSKRQSVVLLPSIYPSYSDEPLMNPMWDSYDGEQFEIRAVGEDDPGKGRIGPGAPAIWCGAGNTGLERVWSLGEYRRDAAGATVRQPVIALYDIASGVELFAVLASDVLPNGITCPDVGASARGNTSTNGYCVTPRKIFNASCNPGAIDTGSFGGAGFDRYDGRGRIFTVDEAAQSTDSGVGSLNAAQMELQTLNPGTLAIAYSSRRQLNRISPRSSGGFIGVGQEVSLERIYPPEGGNFTTTQYKHRVVIGAIGESAPCFTSNNPTFDSPLSADPAIVVNPEVAVHSDDRLYNSSGAFGGFLGLPGLNTSPIVTPYLEILGFDACDTSNWICAYDYLAGDSPASPDRRLTIKTNGSVILDLPNAGIASTQDDFDKYIATNFHAAHPHESLGTGYTSLSRIPLVPGTPPAGWPAIGMKPENESKPWVLSIYKGGLEVYQSPFMAKPPVCLHSSDRWLYVNTEPISPTEMTDGRYTAGPNVGLGFNPPTPGLWHAWMVKHDGSEVMPMGQQTDTDFTRERWPQFGAFLPEMPFSGYPKENPGSFGGLNFDVIKNSNLVPPGAPPADAY